MPIGHQKFNVKVRSLRAEERFLIAPGPVKVLVRDGVPLETPEIIPVTVIDEPRTDVYSVRRAKKGSHVTENS